MLTNKIALVTGASRGIGKGIALALAQAGAIVIGTATSQTGADEISSYLKEIHAHGMGMCLDVKDFSAIHELIAEITEKFGAPNILINNAAITRDNLFIRMKDEEWNDVINVNLSAAYQLNNESTLGKNCNDWFGGRNNRQSWASQLLRGKSGCCWNDKIDCFRTGKSRYYGECRCAGIY